MIITGEYQDIPNPLGLHLRAARRLVELANTFESKIEVERRGGPRVNAKSILGVLLLEGVQGTAVRILADGVDARDALRSVVELVESGFGVL